MKDFPTDLIRLEPSAVIADMSGRTLAQHAKAGKAPAPYKLGVRCVMWSEAELRHWKATGEIIRRTADAEA